jgi:S1-C subfamily serine protease
VQDIPAWEVASMIRKAQKRIFMIGLVAVVAAIVCLIFVHPSLKVTPEVTQVETTDRSAAALGLVVQDTDDGLYILAVRENSLASLAGIRSGDYLQSIDGQSVSTADDLDSILASSGESSITFKVLRYGAEVEISITLP